jgi:hypothetical protein
MIKESESKTLENVHAWTLMYVEYLFFALGFCALIIIGTIGNIPLLF